VLLQAELPNYTFTCWGATQLITYVLLHVFLQAEMLVTVFNSSTMEFVTPFSHPLYKLVDGGNGTRVVATTRHTWSDSPEGLQLRTQMFLGLMARGARDTFDTTWLARKANPKIQEAYR
jgi:hypothetical protein